MEGFKNLEPGLIWWFLQMLPTAPSCVTLVQVQHIAEELHTLSFMFVFKPKRDMRWLRAKEIKDSPNSQAVRHCLKVPSS